MSTRSITKRNSRLIRLWKKKLIVPQYKITLVQRNIMVIKTFFRYLNRPADHQYKQANSRHTGVNCFRAVTPHALKTTAIFTDLAIWKPVKPCVLITHRHSFRNDGGIIRPQGVTALRSVLGWGRDDRLSFQDPRYYHPKAIHCHASLARSTRTHMYTDTKELYVQIPSRAQYTRKHQQKS